MLANAVQFFDSINPGVKKMKDKLISIKSICAFLSISRSTFYRQLKTHPCFSNPSRIGEQIVRYKFSDLVAYCEDEQITPPTSCEGF